jgi:predicted acylesterase/phospholipase RssA
MQDIVNNIDNELKDLLGKNIIESNTTNNKLLNKKILILSGGGTKGFVYYGAFKALEELNILKNIKTFVGTSIGTFFAFLYLCGYNPTEMEEFMYLFNPKKMTSIESLENISFLEIFNKFGLDDGEGMRIVINKLLKGKGIKENATLLDFYQINKKKFIITTVCVNTKDVEYLSYENYPNLKVCDAIRMSTCIPLYYKPVLFNNKYYIDGGFIDNYPINLFKDNLDEVIGLYVENIYEPSDIKDFKDFIISLYKIYNKGYVYNILRNWEKYTILIHVEQTNMLQFELSKEQKNIFFQLGYNAIYDFYKKHK